MFPHRIEGTIPSPSPVADLRAERNDDGVRWTFRTTARRVFGLGERFDSVDQFGKKIEAAVIDKFTEQGKLSYFPVPFFFTELGFSIEVEGHFAVVFDLAAEKAGIFTIDIRCGEESPPALVLRYGSPNALLSAFASSKGLPCLPPDWALGPWISANRWDSRSVLMEQVGIMEELGIPATVAVIEAWSDEGGFFAWNDAADSPGHAKGAGAGADAGGGYEYPAQGRWPDPAGMIAELRERGLRLVLWQVPVCKLPGNCPDQAVEREARALAEAEKGGFLVKRKDGSTYAIPGDRWFGGSPIPDLTNPAAREWYFSKRRYLLDQGVAGFKTDGGEFVHEDDLVFHDGSSGRAMRSGYTAAYLEAYGRFAGPDRVLFSRAGWSGSQRWSTHWAGDQKSEWSELRAQLSAGLSAGLSGAAFWGFDIGGFAGPLPDAELYLRSFALAVFSPLMQWHSEPLYGQFPAVQRASGAVNDRSPWNIAHATGNGRVVPCCRALSRLRMALIPYLSLCAGRAASTGLPIMRHLVLDHPDDPRALATQDEFLLGSDLLVAPVIEPGVESRKVYFPGGFWTDISTGLEYAEGDETEVAAPLGSIPVFRRSGKAIPLDAAWIDGGTPPHLGA
ncbi:MAG: TIM-barrel domain-containing protein [Rectinemataceae bacterium]